MGQRNVRVVVGQGDLEQAGSLRALLERNDFDVVGEAANTSQLARVLTDEQPDIVVLDDAIGIDAVELAAEIAPDARLVVVWPAAVMPIAGAVRVEPSEVTTALSPTVALAAGLGGFAAIDRPEWIERVKKDPATLREMLAARGSLPARPSVTELQRRGHRLHPSPTAAKKASHETEPAAASVIPIGLAAAAADGPEPAEAEMGVAAAAAASVPPDVLSSAWNRRLGVISLSGAAAAGALMIALALGPRSSGIVTAEPLPTYISHIGGPTILGGDGGTQNPDGNGGGNRGPTANGGAGNGGSGTTTTTTTGFTTDGGPTPHGSIGGLGGGTGSSGGGTGSDGTQGDGSPGGPRANSSHLPGAHGTGKPGTPGWRDSTPGESGHHNPHGGPPGHATDHGQGSSHGSSGSSTGGGGSSTGGGGANHSDGGGQSGSGTPGSSGSHANGHASGHANAHANDHAAGDHGRSAAAHRHKR
jgi:hypothetical protein